MLMIWVSPSGFRSSKANQVCGFLEFVAIFFSFDFGGFCRLDANIIVSENRKWISCLNLDFLLDFNHY